MMGGRREEIPLPPFPPGLLSSLETKVPIRLFLSGIVDRFDHLSTVSVLVTAETSYHAT